MYFLEMAHLGEKRSWLSAEEVLEELDEPIMPDSDDELEDLQMDETDSEERCTIESAFRDLSPLLSPDCPPPDTPQDFPTPSPALSPSSSRDDATILSLSPTQGNEFATDLAEVPHSPTHSLSSLQGTSTAGAHATPTPSLATPLMLPQLLLARGLGPATRSHPLSRGSEPSVDCSAPVDSPTPPQTTTSVPTPPPQPSTEKWTTDFEPVDVSPFIQSVGPTFDICRAPAGALQISHGSGEAASHQ